jgi:AcrR family transcriptional regulator
MENFQTNADERCDMPRIAAASIEEHVRIQSGKILDAANDLFRKHGYRRTDIGDIGEAIGLARNSLYRYFPNKDHILLACVWRDMQPFLERMQELVNETGDPIEQLETWLDLQLDIATSPAHATMEMISEIRSESPELQREIHRLHQAPNAVLRGALTQLMPGSQPDIALLADLIGGLVQAASLHAMQNGNAAAVKPKLRTAVHKLLDQE